MFITLYYLLRAVKIMGNRPKYSLNLPLSNGTTTIVIIERQMDKIPLRVARGCCQCHDAASTVRIYRMADGPRSRSLVAVPCYNANVL